MPLVWLYLFRCFACLFVECLRCLFCALCVAFVFCDFANLLLFGLFGLWFVIWICGLDFVVCYLLTFGLVFSFVLVCGCVICGLGLRLVWLSCLLFDLVFRGGLCFVLSFVVLRYDFGFDWSMCSILPFGVFGC